MEMEDQLKTAKYWFSRACTATILVKCYENAGLTALAQHFTEEAIFFTAMGLKALAFEHGEKSFSESVMKVVIADIKARGPISEALNQYRVEPHGYDQPAK